MEFEQDGAADAFDHQYPLHAALIDIFADPPAGPPFVLVSSGVVASAQSHPEPASTTSMAPAPSASSATPGQLPSVDATGDGPGSDVGDAATADTSVPVPVSAPHGPDIGACPKHSLRCTPRQL
ncbi:hypothetical protein ACHAQA_007648 [Verticillium albo-atrum]